MYNREGERIALTFNVVGGLSGQTSFALAGNGAANSSPILLLGRGDWSFLVNYKSAQDLSLYIGARDPIGYALGGAEFINIEGVPFLVDTLPATGNGGANNAGRIMRVAGLPAIDIVRFTIVAGNAAATINGFQIIFK